MTTPSPTRSAPVIVGLAIAAFVGLGLPEGSIGVAFPQIQITFDQPLSALGLLLLPYSGGYILCTLSHGRLLAPRGTGNVLIGAAVASCGASLLYVAGPAFGFLIVGSALFGISAGCIDAALNSYVSIHLPHRILAFMHAGFGVGATLGPLALTVLLGSGASWRVAYAALAVLQIGLGIAWFLVRHRFEPGHAAAGDVVAFEGDVADTPIGADVVGDGVQDGRYDGPRARAVRMLNVMMFFLYVGTEASTGFLVATLLIERGLSAEAAGLLTTMYWASLALGRVLTGVVGPRLAPQRALVAATAGAFVGTIVVWSGGTGRAAVGLIVVGLALAPIFPSLVSLTPSRVGARRTSSAIGFQLAAASLGASVAPTLIGIVAATHGAWIIGPALVVVAFLLTVGNLVTSAVSANVPRATPVPRT